MYGISYDTCDYFKILPNVCLKRFAGKEISIIFNVKSVLESFFREVCFVAIVNC